MVNLVEAQKPLLHFLIRRTGLRQHNVDVDGAGTVISFWMPKDKVPKDKATVRDVTPGQEAETNKMKQKTKKERPAVVLVHGFAAEGIVTWQFQVRLNLFIMFKIITSRREHTHLYIYAHTDRCAGEALRRVRAGPALLRRVDVAVGGPVAGIPGGVPGGRAPEAGRGAVRGGGVQLRRDGVVQDGGVAPGPGALARGLRLRHRHDRLHQRDRAGADRGEVVVRAAAAGVRQGAQGAALHCHAQEALVPRPPSQGLPRGTVHGSRSVFVLIEPSRAQGAGDGPDERRGGLCTQVMFNNRKERAELLEGLVVSNKDATVPVLQQVLVWPPLFRLPAVQQRFWPLCFDQFCEPLHKSPSYSSASIHVLQAIDSIHAASARSLMLPQSQKRERAALFLLQENPSEYDSRT
jgi:hypothetical protein